MAAPKIIGCFNHPGTEAMGRCRQCSKPICKECGFVTPAGMYCSNECRDKHEDFMKRATDVDLSKRQKRSLRARLGSVFSFVVVLVVLFFGALLLGWLVHIPYLSSFSITVRSFLGLM